MAGRGRWQWWAGRREIVRPARPSNAPPAKKFAQHAPSNAPPAKKFAQHARKHQFWAIMSTQGELFRAHTHHQTPQGELFRAKDALRWDGETNDTSTTTDTGQRETTITNARP